MEAEEILKKNGVLLEDFISGSTHSACLSAMEEYHQSQLQALKEEVEDIPCSGNTFHAENFKKRVLNFITNLEDK